MRVFLLKNTDLFTTGDLGFPHVHNVNADFYALIDDPSGASLPEYDVLVTNPPFSGRDLHSNRWIL